MVGGSKIEGTVMRKIGAGVGAIFCFGILVVGIGWAAGLRVQDLGAVGIFEGHGDAGTVGRSIREEWRMTRRRRVIWWRVAGRICGVGRMRFSLRGRRRVGMWRCRRRLRF